MSSTKKEEVKKEVASDKGATSTAAGTVATATVTEEGADKKETTTAVVEGAETVETEKIADEKTPAAKKVVESEVVEVKQKQVSAKVLKNHTCHIGGKDYEFKKNQEVKLPYSDALILQQGGVILMRD